MPITKKILAGAQSKPVTGQQEYLTAGTYSFVVPTGVTKISIVAIGGGRGGGGTTGGTGGGLAYLNNQVVTPGETLTIVVGAGGAGGWYNVAGSTGFNSYVVRASSNIILARGGGLATAQIGTASYLGGAGGTGGVTLNGTFGQVNCSPGGGGAGGYAGNGGAGASVPASTGSASGGAGSGGSGGGGGATRQIINSGSAPTGSSYGCSGNIGNSGGVSVYGQAANGLETTSGYSLTSSAAGGIYGGGGGGGTLYYWGTHPGGPQGVGVNGGAGGNGAIRLIWPGDSRFFPSTRTANE